MFAASDRVVKAIEGQFGGGRVLVVGDLMLDAYLWGDVSRISPEAPVPVVRINRRSESAGGAGNVLLNLARLGLEVSAAGVVGDDHNGRRLRRLLESDGVSTEAVIVCEGRATVAKTRVVCGHQQMIRLDEEPSPALPDSDLARLARAAVDSVDDSISAVILSDYAKGALTATVCRGVIDAACRRGIPVLVDPKGRDYSKFAGATTLTPNRLEFETVTGLADALEGPDAQDASRRLIDDLGLDFLVVTLGDRGIRLVERSGSKHFPVVSREVFDVSGAGDTVIATLAAALTAGLTVDEGLTLANLAAGIVVGKVGTTPIDRGELLAAVRLKEPDDHSDKVLDLSRLAPRLADWRARGERVVFTNGCFDLLHVGHVSLLAKARREGERLVVGLNSDASVRSLKGNSRPVVTQDDRALVLAGLSSVDAVVIFDEETPLRLIESIGPDVLVKGADYIESEVVGACEVRSRGGRVVLVPLTPGRSTTRILNGRKPQEVGEVVASC